AGDRRRQAVAEALVELAEVFEGRAPFAAVDGEDLGQARGADVHARQGDRARGGDVPDRGLHGLGATVDAAEDPLENAYVLAVAGPVELALVVLAAPVDA